MEGLLQNSTNFVLTGLITRPAFPRLLFAIVFSIFLVAVTANVVMILLIHTDSRLHTPMYFLLSQLSIMDTIYICITVPKMLQDLLSKDKTISFLGCAVQIFLYLTPIGGEFSLLGLMAYDRSREINHFFCEIPAVLKLSCIDTSLYETLMYACCVLMLLIPLSVISVSYTHILLTVHRMNSAEGRRKAFATCPSHFMVGRAFSTGQPSTPTTLQRRIKCLPSTPSSPPCSTHSSTA
ncbi:olfactory receptor 2T2-like [Hylobates moloch]|uniref:olfactory receptor 2T2-like n=1 Tax=Hylobates moloch TaxID=81572 RepID=UPI0026772E76|nr:olfactory receptor 2T2-like [Hylobates moloch]